MSITQEQIERLRLSVDEAHHDEFPAGYEPVGLQALLDAYEERGREVERLRAKVGDHDSARQAEKERADHAESEVERLRVERDSLAKGIKVQDGYLLKRAELAEARLREVVAALEVYSADLDSKGGADFKPVARVLAAAQPEEESRGNE